MRRRRKTSISVKAYLVFLTLYVFFTIATQYPY